MKVNMTKQEFEYLIDNCGFTDEEIKVLNLNRKGMTYLEIANEMSYCEKTIKNRCASIKLKMKKMTSLK